MAEIFVRIHPHAAKENPDLILDLPASVVTDGGGSRRLKVGEVAGVDESKLLIQRALSRGDIIVTQKKPAPPAETSSKPATPAPKE